MLCRYDAHSGGEREMQRTMLELLNQLDGFEFDSRYVKVILAPKRSESLDPAVLRPGRIDRKVEFPLLDMKTRRHIFQVSLTSFVKTTPQMLLLLIHYRVILICIFCLMV